ncbi:MAG: hypothetical protein M3065_05660 [Actinomycetota bacterium]|nr:hypothetical protein [Actinomycetota bacterium]
MPDTYQLPARETELLAQLLATGAPSFEHDHSGVISLATERQVRISASRQELRALNHHPARLLRFDRSKAPRWIFALSPHACEFA